MCQSTAYLMDKDKKELLMEDVSEVIPEDNGLTLKGLLGKSKFVEAEIIKMDLMEHEILLEKNQ